MDYYLFTDPKGWKAELTCLADP